MAEELNLDGLQEMKKADFIKAFKNKAAWKKAKAVIFLVDYKLQTGRQKDDNCNSLQKRGGNEIGNETPEEGKTAPNEKIGSRLDNY